MDLSRSIYGSLQLFLCLFTMLAVLFVDIIDIVAVNPDKRSLYSSTQTLSYVCSSVCLELKDDFERVLMFRY